MVRGSLRMVRGCPTSESWQTAIPAILFGVELACSIPRESSMNPAECVGRRRRRIGISEFAAPSSELGSRSAKVDVLFEVVAYGRDGKAGQARLGMKRAEPRVNHSGWRLRPQGFLRKLARKMRARIETSSCLGRPRKIEAERRDTRTQVSLRSRRCASVQRWPRECSKSGELRFVRFERAREKGSRSKWIASAVFERRWCREASRRDRAGSTLPNSQYGSRAILNGDRWRSPERGGGRLQPMNFGSSGG
jgi:hypothetical protein